MGNTEKKYISLENLQNYHENIVGKISNSDAITLESAKEYTDESVAQKTQVQFCVWEGND